MNFTSNKPYLFRAILEWLLDNEATPYILVDANQAYVEVPHEYIKDGQIVLNINPSAIQSWHSDNEAISFSARFGGVARQIYVPMDALLAIYAQENGLGMAFPAQDNSAEGQASSQKSAAETGGSRAERESLLEGVSAEKTLSESDSTQAKSSNPQKKVSHLKVVK
ncbi:ClpXP protease specificity-enhancing factor [Aliikangiella maris]|uniref:ClpXP protease specificity-enhancing factor n=2 Tax=Aliikangiella maris TaxID=3162458 RepID=A0ABV3MJ52_9GAMM